MRHDGYAVPGSGRALWGGHGPSLGRFEVELTQRCNNACVHCYINEPADDGACRARELPAAVIIETLGEAADLGILAVRFTGGEPLLRDDFPEIYAATRRLGLTVSLLTNACLVTDAIASLLGRIPPLEPVSVSVYGMDEESYEAVTGVSGSYAQMRRGVRRLVDHGVPLALSGTLLPQTAGQVELLQEWAGALGAPAPTFVTYLHGRGRRDRPEKGRRIRALRSSPGIVSAFHASLGERQASDDALGQRGDRLFICDAGHRICLDAYGTLLPCLLVRHPDVAYELASGSLTDAVTEFFPALRQRRVESRSYLDRCARCFLGSLCEQCPAWSWTETGTLDTPVEYVCECAHERARDLGLLRDGERAWEVEREQGRSQAR